jgi:hypothetical protein
MLSGRASARITSMTIPAAIALAAWVPRFGAERLPVPWSILITVACAVAAGLLLADALRIERVIREDLRARRSGDPRKRRKRM